MHAKTVPQADVTCTSLSETSLSVNKVKQQRICHWHTAVEWSEADSALRDCTCKIVVFASSADMVSIPGADQHYDLQLDFLEAVFGCK